MRGLIFHVFRQALPYCRLAQISDYVFVSWKFFLQILVAQVVPIENPVDDIASPFGISSNMLIKAAITKISFFKHFLHN